MKKGLILLLALLLFGSVCMAESGNCDVLGQWQMTCTINSAHFSDDAWEQSLTFEADGSVAAVQDGESICGTWTAAGSSIYTSLDEPFACMQLLDNGLLLCGSYGEGIVFTRDGKMPAYEPVEGGVSEDGFYYQQLEDGTLEITGHVSGEEAPEFDENDVMTNPVDLVLPASIHGIPVRSVGMLAFYGNIRLRSAVLPEGMYHLGREAFNDCVMLETVQLPESLNSIGGYVFSNCVRLHQVRIPSQVRYIDFNPFTNCMAIHAFDLAPDNRWYRLEDGALVENATNDLIAFPSGTERTAFSVPGYVTRIRLGAFMGCENLEEVILPEGLVTLESFVFEGSGLRKVNVPSTLTVMESNPFHNCRSLEAVDVSPLNTVFGSVDGVLFDADRSRLIYYPIGRAADTYTVPEGTRVIGADAFSRNRKLTQIMLPSSLEVIEDYAFYKMCSLTRMTIPEGVTQLGSYVFCECDELRRVTVPSTVTQIKYAVFGYCQDLEVVVPKGIQIDEFAFENAERITITYQ